MGRPWLKGYLPADNVGPTVEPIIRAAIQEYDGLGRHAKRVPWLVAALPLRRRSSPEEDFED